MNTKALWITGIAIIGIVVLITRGGVPSRVPVDTIGEDTATVMFYDQSTGESTNASFTSESVTFTNAKLGTITLPQTISASGARYANADESIVFWNKGDSVFITQNGIIIFNGSTGESVTKPSGKLAAGSAAPGNPKELIGTWVWQKTVMRDAPVITPKKPGVFTLTLTGDGKVSGKTDCNGFGGEYAVGSDGILSFGPFMSTLMYCEGSQEGEFNGPLSKANRYSFDVDGNLVINIDNDAGSMIFSKK